MNKFVLAKKRFEMTSAVVNVEQETAQSVDTVQPDESVAPSKNEKGDTPTDTRLKNAERQARMATLEERQIRRRLRLHRDEVQEQEEGVFLSGRGPLNM